MSAMEDSLRRIFHPRSVALVGASSRFRWQSLRAMARYRGRLYGVNPGVRRHLGVPFYPSIRDLPEPVDYAILLTPAPTIPRIVEECGERGIHAVQILSSGFRDAGTPRGAALERRVLAAARRHGIRLLGPNCLGVYCPGSGLSFRPNFTARPGPIGVVSQSGGFAIGLVLWGQERGLGFSKVVNYGNGADIEGADLLDFLARDPQTRVIAAYAEGPRDPPRYLQALRHAARRKPVVVLPSGRTPAGARAARRHTGTAPRGWTESIPRTGAIPVDNLTDMAETAAALALLPRPHGRRVTFVGMSGGDGVAAADATTEAGLRMDPLGPRARTRLLRTTGKNLDNPVDMAATYLQPPALQATLRTLAADPGTDILMVEVPTRVLAPDPRLPQEQRLPRVLRRSLQQARLHKPTVAILRSIEAGGRRWKFAQDLYRAGVPVFPETATAARVLARLPRR